jgi:hypothetical protein
VKFTGSQVSSRLGRIAGIFLLVLVVLPFGAFPPSLAAVAGGLWILWILTHRRLERLEPFLFGLSLFIVLGATITHGDGGSLRGPASFLFRHHGSVSFVLLTVGIALLIFTPSSPPKRGSVRTCIFDEPHGWMLFVVVVLVSVFIACFFYFLVRWGDPLWVHLRPVVHDLLILALSVTLISSRAGQISYRIARRRLRFVGLFMVVVVPIQLVATVIGSVGKPEPPAGFVAIEQVHEASRGLLLRLLNPDLSYSPKAAANKMEALLEEHPDDPVLNFHGGLVFSCAGDHEMAEAAFRACGERADGPWGEADLIDPRATEFGIRRLKRLGELNAAQRVCEKALGRFPDAEELGVLFGELLTVCDRGDTEEFLKTRMPPCAHREYLLGVWAERRREESRAKEQYRNACQLLPGHRKSWEGLERVAYANPELFSETESGNIERTLGRFGLPLRPDEDIHGFAMVRGARLSIPAAPSTGEVVPATAVSLSHGDFAGIRVWPGSQLDVEVEAEFETRCAITLESLALDGGRWLRKELPLEGYRAVRGEWGQVRRVKLRTRVPENMLPGDYQLQLRVRQSSEESQGLPLPSANVVLTDVHLFHRLERSAASAWKLESLCGKKSFVDVGRRTVVAAGWRVEIPVPAGKAYEACILVTGVSYGGGTKQGETIGQVSLVPKEGAACVVPFRMGFETADIYADRPSRRRSIEEARIWSSFPVSSGGEDFEAHTYFTLVELRESMEVERACVEVFPARQLFLHVFHVVFIEAGDNEDQ